jgi:hypothetical protein
LRPRQSHAQPSRRCRDTLWYDAGRSVCRRPDRGEHILDGGARGRTIPAMKRRIMQPRQFALLLVRDRPIGVGDGSTLSPFWLATTCSPRTSKRPCAMQRFPGKLGFSSTDAGSGPTCSIIRMAASRKSMCSGGSCRRGATYRADFDSPSLRFRASISRGFSLCGRIAAVQPSGTAFKISVRASSPEHAAAPQSRCARSSVVTRTK